MEMGFAARKAKIQLLWTLTESPPDLALCAPRGPFVVNMLHFPQGLCFEG